MTHPCKKNRMPFWYLLGFGAMILLPFSILVIAASVGGASDASEPSIIVGMMTIPLALMLFDMARALFKVRIEIDETSGRVRGSLPCSAALFSLGR